MKNFYYAFIVEFENGKYISGWDSVSSSDNLMNSFRTFEGINYDGQRGKIVAANMCETKKAARDLAEAWCNSFRDNGTHISLYAPIVARKRS